MVFSTKYFTCVKYHLGDQTQTNTDRYRILLLNSLALQNLHVQRKVTHVQMIPEAEQQQKSSSAQTTDIQSQL